MSNTGLVFNERNHKYRLDGAACPGVTTLIGKGLPKPQLTYWAAKSVAHGYLLDALGSLGSDVATLSMVAATKPIVITGKSDALRVLLMPIRTS